MFCARKVYSLEKQGHDITTWIITVFGRDFGFFIISRGRDLAKKIIYTKKHTIREQSGFMSTTGDSTYSLRTLLSITYCLYIITKSLV